MGLETESPAYADLRRAGRDDVDYRACAVALDGGQYTLLIVNISPHGLMARCDAPVEVGTRVRVTLPEVGAIDGVVRWALGGRLGCEFAEAIDLAGYYDLLAALVRRK